MSIRAALGLHNGVHSAERIVLNQSGVQPRPTYAAFCFGLGKRVRWIASCSTDDATVTNPQGCVDALLSLASTPPWAKIAAPASGLYAGTYV